MERAISCVVLLNAPNYMSSFMVEYSVLVNALPITSTTVTYGGLYVLQLQLEDKPRSQKQCGY